MTDFNIETNNTEIDVVINVLKKDKLDIEESVKKIEEIVNKLDRTVWNSPEKKQIEEELFPFLKKNTTTIPNTIAECNMVLEQANEKYKERDLSLEKSSSKLAN